MDWILSWLWRRGLASCASHSWSDDWSRSPGGKRYKPSTIIIYRELSVLPFRTMNGPIGRGLLPFATSIIPAVPRMVHMSHAANFLIDQLSLTTDPTPEGTVPKPLTKLKEKGPSHYPERMAFSGMRAVAISDGCDSYFEKSYWINEMQSSNLSFSSCSQVIDRREWLETRNFHLIEHTLILLLCKSCLLRLWSNQILEYYILPSSEFWVLTGSWCE